MNDNSHSRANRLPVLYTNCAAWCHASFLGHSSTSSSDGLLPVALRRRHSRTLRLFVAKRADGLQHFRSFRRQVALHPPALSLAHVFIALPFRMNPCLFSQNHSLCSFGLLHLSNKSLYLMYTKKTSYISKRDFSFKSRPCKLSSSNKRCIFTASVEALSIR